MRSPGAERDRWEALASTQPYWTVLVEDRFRAEHMSPSDRRAFFETGERDVVRTLDAVRRIFPDFRPRVTVDYGCGVGRLSIPLARASERVIGVDVSERMLAEARRNCLEAGAANVDFMTATSFLANPDAVCAADFVHSYIVFQHIAPTLGLHVTEVLLRRLVPGGMGALHYSLGRETTLAQRVINPLRRWVPLANALVNVARGRPSGEPLVPVFDYDVAALLRLFQRHGCMPVCLQYERHGRFDGAVFLFRKATS